MAIIFPILLFLGLGLAQYENGYGSIFELSDSQSATDSSPRIISPTSRNVSNLVPTGTSTWMSPPESTNWNSQTTQTTVPISQHPGANSSVATTQVLATVEVHIGNLSGTGVIVLSDLPTSKPHSSNCSTTTMSPVSTSGPENTSRPCFTCTDSPKVPPFPANSTNVTGVPTASLFTFANPSLLSLSNKSAGPSRRDRSSLVSAILAPLMVMIFL